MRKLVKEQKGNVKDAQRLTSRSSSSPTQRWGQEKCGTVKSWEAREGPSFWRGCFMQLVPDLQGRMLQAWCWDV